MFGFQSIMSNDSEPWVVPPDPVSCLLYPNGTTLPVLTCGSLPNSPPCYADALLIATGIALIIPVFFLVFLKLWFMWDPLLIRYLWWKEHRDRFRLVMNFPRAFLVFILYLDAFGKLLDKFIHSGTCRNDSLSPNASTFLLVTLGINLVFVPLAKAAYEATFYVERTLSAEVEFSQWDQWRQHLVRPCLDLALTGSPILAALLLPEGHQTSEATGRFCIRGWGCHASDVNIAVAFVGSVVMAGVLFCLGIALFCVKDSPEATQRRVHWTFVAAFPPWLVWFGYCTVTLALARTPGYKRLNWLVNFDFPSITDPPTYDMVSAIVFVSLGLDCVAYLCFAVLMYLTYTPTRTPHGGSRKVGPKMNPPRMYNVKKGAADFTQLGNQRRRSSLAKVAPSDVDEERGGGGGEGKGGPRRSSQVVGRRSSQGNAAVSERQTSVSVGKAPGRQVRYKSPPSESP